MRLLFGYPGWGWKMWGILGKENRWFVGFSMQERKPEESNADREKRISNAFARTRASSEQLGRTIAEWDRKFGAPNAC